MPPSRALSALLLGVLACAHIAQGAVHTVDWRVMMPTHELTVQCGDVVKFVFGDGGAHDVYEVDPLDDAASPALCNQQGGIGRISDYFQTAGYELDVTFNAAGKRAFICTFPSHCNPMMMYLQVTIVGCKKRASSRRLLELGEDNLDV